MTIPPITVATLKQVKNTVIGNPLAKVQFVKDEGFVLTLIDCLNPPTTEGKISAPSRAAHDALRIEAAHVIASLSYGSDEALGTLLRANAHHHFLYALSHFTTNESSTLRQAFSRALRAFASSTADIVGPSLWGLRPDKSRIRNEAQQALDYLFQIESLDIYLPLLVIPNSSPPSVAVGIAISTAQMLSTTIRLPTHRTLVTEWLPLSERQREVKSRRGWEKTVLSGHSSAPWVARQLLALLGDSQRERDNKLIEAALSALAALAHENPVVAIFLGKAAPDRDHPPPLANILAFTKSRSVDIQLAACLCITHVLRACPPSPPTSAPSHPHLSSAHASSPTSGHVPSGYSNSTNTANAHSFVHVPNVHNHASLEESGTRTVMNVVNRMLALPPATAGGVDSLIAGQASDSPQTKTKACFILHYLVSDEPALCHIAFDRGCLEYLGALIQSITPAEPPPPEWEEGEPESIQCLREASLTALASLALCYDDIRRRITDELRLLPCISRALRAKRHVGTRYAACQCVRAMSRSVSVLRTSIVDSGLGMDVLRIVLGKDLGDRFGGSVSGVGGITGMSGLSLGKNKNDSAGREKRRDTDEGGDQMDVVEGVYVKGGALWLGEDRRVLGAALSAVCNIVNDFSPLRPIYLEERLMPRLVYIIRQSDDAPLRLNALWAVKNLVRKTSTETKRDIMSHLGWSELNDFFSDPDREIQEQAFNLLRNLAENEEGIAMVFREIGDEVLSKITAGLRSPSEDVVLQAAFAVANLSNGTREQQDLILHHPDMLPALQTCLAEAPPAIRRPAVSCVLVLAQSNPRRRKEMHDAGIVGTLKRLCEWSGHGHGSHGAGNGHGYGTGSFGMSQSPTSSSGAAYWGGRSPVRSPASMHGGGGAGSSPAAGMYGSWSGSGSMHAYAAAHSLAGHGGGMGVGGIGIGIGAGARTHGAHSHSQSWGTAHMGLLEDDRDVVMRARQALEWLEHGETYIS